MDLEADPVTEEDCAPSRDRCDRKNARGGHQPESSPYPQMLLALILNGQVVLNLGDTGGRPRGTFGDIALVPGPDLAAEDHPPAFGLDGDPGCLDLGATLQSFLDLFFDVGGTNRRGVPDLVDD